MLINTRGLLPIVLFAAVAFANAQESETVTTSVLAGLAATPEEIAELRAELEISKACSPVAEEEQWQHFIEGSVAKWDRQIMNCAIESGYAVAQRQPDSVEINYAVWSAAIDYFEVLDLLYDPYYKGGDLFMELGWRWEKNIERATVLTEALSKSELDQNSKLVFEALLALTATMQETSSQEQMMAQGQALPKLATAVGADLSVAEGLGAMLLGRVLFQVPAFVGGDPAKAAELLGASIQTNPNLFHSYPWLIDALLVLERRDEANAVLEQSKQVAQDAINPQDYVDFANRMKGMAIRLGIPETETYFFESREKMLAANPQLLPREAKANMGHGGVDPFTGEKLDY
jgi:hypothetical protein